MRDRLRLDGTNRPCKKLRIYAREAVSHVWLLSPEARTLEVMRRQGDQWLLVAVYESNQPVRAEPFDAIDLAWRAFGSAPAPADPTPAVPQDPGSSPHKRRGTTVVVMHHLLGRLRRLKT